MTVFKKGDVVSMRATVEYVSEDGQTVGVTTRRYPDTQYCGPDDLTLVSPKFVVGEWVTVLGKDRGRIEAIVEDRAWVMRPDICSAPVHDVYPLTALERAPQLVQSEQEPSWGQALADSHKQSLEWKPMEGHDPVAAVLGALNADPNVNDAFKGGEH
jgi:hypothetical protein